MDNSHGGGGNNKPALAPFSFDDPDDDYWNVSSTSTRSHHNAPLENLFDFQQLPTQPVRPITPTPGQSAPSGNPSANLPHAELVRSGQHNSVASDLQSVTSDDVSSLSISDAPPQVVRDRTPMGRGGSVSLLSNDCCSLNSIPNSDLTVHLDYARLKHEHRKLQRHFESARNQRFRPPTIEETIRRLKKSQPAPLDWYRTMQEKMELLSLAERSLDHDVIVTVVLFLKRSLSNTLFRQAMEGHSQAAEHYLTHLREVGDHSEMIDSLYALGRVADATMAELSLATKRRQPEQRISALKKCLMGGLVGEPNLLNEHKFTKDYVNLLERQLAIEAADGAIAKAGKMNEWMRRIPTKASLIGQSLYTTLYYCCLYHYDLTANSFSSPHCLREAFRLSDREFAFVAVSALSRLQRFGELEKLLTCKKLIAGYKLASPIPWWEFFNLLRRHGCPPREHLNKWLRAVGNAEERLRICEMLGSAHEVEVEILIVLGERQKLIALMNRLQPGSAEFNKGEAALISGTSKWKN